MRWHESVGVLEIMSTGFSGAESAGIRIGDIVAVFAQGPISLCATAGAKLSGASVVIGVDRLPNRLQMAGKMGADHVIDSSKLDPVEEIMRLTGGRGVDVAIEALVRGTYRSAAGQRRCSRERRLQGQFTTARPAYN